MYSSFQYLSKVVQGKNSGEPAIGSWVAKSHCTWGSEGWPMWSDPTESLLLKLLKKLRLFLIERCQNTQQQLFFFFFCVWGCIATDQSGCPCWPPSTVESANNGHMSIRTGPQSNGRRWSGLMNHVFYYIRWMAGCVCLSLTLGTHGTRMHYGKKASWRRQCDAFGNVLLGNLGSCHPCGCYSDMYHLPKHCCRPCFMETVFPDGCGLVQQDNTPCHKAKLVQEWFEEHNNEFEVLT